jgi:hypothetical protein
MKADLTDLFVLDEAFEEGAIRASFVSAEVEFSRLAVGDCKGTVLLSQESGTRALDLVGTTRAGFYLLSQRVQEALLSANVNGWRPCPVEFLDDQGRAFGQYAVIGITAHCGRLDNTRSRKVMSVSPKSGKPVANWVGLYFEEESWDGSDLFRPEGSLLTIVTSRAKGVFENIGALNIRFRRLLEVKRLVL